MKVRKSTLGDFAYHMLQELCDGGDLASVAPDMTTIEKAELCIHIMRSIAEGKRRIQIDIEDAEPGQ